MAIKPLSNQQTMWHGLGSRDLPGQQDLFNCDLGVDEDEKPDAKPQRSFLSDCDETVCDSSFQ